MNNGELSSPGDSQNRGMISAMIFLPPVGAGKRDDCRPFI